MSQTLNWNITFFLYIIVQMTNGKQKWTVCEQKILFTKFLCWKDDN